MRCCGLHAGLKGCRYNHEAVQSICMEFYDLVVALLLAAKQNNEPFRRFEVANELSTIDQKRPTTDN